MTSRVKFNKKQYGITWNPYFDMNTNVGLRMTSNWDFHDYEHGPRKSRMCSFSRMSEFCPIPGKTRNPVFPKKLDIWNFGGTWNFWKIMISAKKLNIRKFWDTEEPWKTLFSETAAHPKTRGTRKFWKILISWQNETLKKWVAHSSTCKCADLVSYKVHIS